MTKYENDCVGCERCGFCGAKETPHHYCDRCDEETYEYYEFDGGEYCEACLRKELIDRADEIIDYMFYEICKAYGITKI